MTAEKKLDELGDFLTKYGEYLRGERGYYDIPMMGGSKTIESARKASLQTRSRSGPKIELPVTKAIKRKK